MSRNQSSVNFIFHFAELQSGSSITDKKTVFGNYVLKCNKVKRILISSNCFSEYIFVPEDYFILANSANPDEMPPNVAFHQGLHCLP